MADKEESSLEKRKIYTERGDPTIGDLCSRIDRGKLVARADFQRKYVWEKRTKLKSKLIESVLLNFPIPVIYTSENPDGSELVIDGQQRLLTFYNFMKEGGFALSGLEILRDLNDKTFKTLPEEPINLKDKIENYHITVIKILKESHPDIKFDMFERLNRGSVKLNEQEVRNCIFRGSFNSLLKELSHNRDFLRMQNLIEPHNRMLDVERILRFFAFCDRTEHNYKSPIKTFLNKYMDGKREISDVEREEKIKLFKKCSELCRDVFGNIAFRRWHTGWGEEYRDGYSDSKINEGIIDIQMYGFMEYDKNQILPKAQVIKDAFIDICGDEQFIESVEIGTYDTARVKIRVDKWFGKLKEIVGYPENDRRLYTYEEKKFLFERPNGNVCKLCKNEIADINDAHVDHIERFSEGGKTDIRNGQLTHRYCNLHKN